MKRLALAALALAAVAHAAPDPDRIRDLDPRDDDKLRRPRGNLDFVAAADYVLGLGGDLPGHRGAGGAVGAYVMPEAASGGAWRTRWGGQLTAFGTHATGSLNGRVTDENLGGAMFLMEYGKVRDIAERWEIGLNLGAGVGLFYGVVDDGVSTHRKGNWDWVVQAKPTLTYKFRSGLNLFVAYRLAYMAPFYDTELLGRPTTKIFYNAAEIGVAWRF